MPPGYDAAAIEAKWQKRWDDAKAFEPDPMPGTPKFLCTFPYPYTNGLPHVGHLFSAMRVEALARYKRMRGFHTLWPQGWHCTGQPISTAAMRIKEGDEQQIQILRDFGVPDSEVHLFANPLHWIEYFPPRYEEDWRHAGLSIDWRRAFITTELNQRYDKFIRWQFRKLKEKGYVALGKHPVVWCPKEGGAVGDHGRRSGEGETPQEFVLILFELEATTDAERAFVPVATLRPETIDGVTNLWASPTIEYVRATVDGAHWIVSRECAEKLRDQEHDVHIDGTVPGASLIGKRASLVGSNNAVPILPASFPKADKGTGIVMSVPSDAPDDYIALRDIQRDEKQIALYKLDSHAHGHTPLADITPIPVIRSSDLGDLAAVTVCEQMKIQNQKERDKLEAAKKLVYKKGFYEGTMLTGPYKGEKVEVAKERIKADMLEEGSALKFWELTGAVVCRCLTPCIVRVVSNQWFLLYNTPEWKERTHLALSRMQLFPEKSRAQFDYVIDWLREWACTRAEGLGTRLPWDEQWLIESLSDSTLYNSYYTFSHILKDIPEHEIDDALFDYVLLSKGDAKHASWKTMRDSFNYWYPVDLRSSGKDLIQSHLAFMLFTHVAILPEDKWPRGYGVNGHVTVDGAKMSKSVGNVIPVRALLRDYGADTSRLTIISGGEGMDDANWDSELARSTRTRFAQLLDLFHEHARDDARTRHTHLPIDDWFQSRVHRIIKQTTVAMEEMNFRTAIQIGWFDLGNTIKRYLKLTNGEPNTAVFRFALETQLKLIQPFAPHIAAECWEILGLGTQGKLENSAASKMLAFEPWPTADENLIDDAIEATQDLIEQLAQDIRSVQQLVKLERLSGVTVIVAQEWLYDFVRDLRVQLRETRDIRTILPVLTKAHHARAADITKLVPNLVRDPSKIPPFDTNQAHEKRAVDGAVAYLTQQFNCPITVVRAEESKEAKAKNAFPGKPAILLS